MRSMMLGIMDDPYNPTKIFLGRLRDLAGVDLFFWVLGQKRMRLPLLLVG